MPESLGKPSQNWITDRLTQLASLRRTKLPEDVSAFASALSGFGQDTISKACHKIETSNPDKGEPAFPRLGKLLEECRHYASHEEHHGHHWSVEDYRLCKAFDLWMSEQMETHHITQAQLLTQVAKKYPSFPRKWMAWKNQLEAGTLLCPHWCDKCDGTGWVRIEDQEGNTFTQRCHVCKK